MAEHTTVLLVEQNPPLERRVARDAVVLDTGRVVHAAPAAELMADDALLDSQLGVSGGAGPTGEAVAR